MKPVRIGVVGLGWVGCARHIPTLRSNPRFKLVGIADRKPERVADVGRKMPGVVQSTSLRLRDVSWIDEVDAVSVATAPFAHHDLVCEALELGIDVITEKPFAMSVSEGAAMVSTAQSTQRNLAIVHNFQFSRSMTHLLNDVTSGKLGEIRNLRALQTGNPQRRLPEWYEQLPLGLFYDESPHLLYLLQAVAGELTLTKAVSVENRHGKATPDQIDAWFGAKGVKYPITLSCNFESSISEWYLFVHGDKGVGIVDIFRDIYVRLPNDGTHGTKDVIRTSLSATWQHWWQHIASGIPHLTGKLRYGNNDVFDRFGRAVQGEADAIAPISAQSALATLTLQHEIISRREGISL